MSYIYLQEQGEESLAECFLDIPQSVLLNLINMQDRSCLQDKEIIFYQSSLSGMTSQPLMEGHGEGLQTLCVEDSPAKTSAVQVRGLELKEVEVGYGSTWQELSVKLDQDTFLPKTHQCLWEEDLPLCSVILPAWGMMQDGVFLEQMILGVITCARGVGYWPTPLKEEGPGFQQMKLTDAIAIAEGFRPRYYSIDGMDEKEAFIGKVNPEWVEWLMGWPMGWTNVSIELGTDKFQLWLQWHGRF